jgi:ABC-type Fe3+ transport system substrate-binding protein
MQKLGGDEEDDPLLNPAHVLIGTDATNKTLANEFTDWLIGAEGGQKVLETFSAGGVVLYSPAPKKKLQSKL